MFKPKIWDQKKGLTATISETQTALPEPKSSTQALVPRLCFVDTEI